MTSGTPITAGDVRRIKKAYQECGTKRYTARCVGFNRSIIKKVVEGKYDFLLGKGGGEKNRQHNSKKD